MTLLLREYCVVGEILHEAKNKIEKGVFRRWSDLLVLCSDLC